MSEKENLICEDCNSEEGVEVVCPYEYDVNNERVEVILCAKCEHNREMEI